MKTLNIKRIKELVTRLSSVGDAVTDRRVVQITLGAPLKSYDPFVQAVLCQDELPHFSKLHRKLLLEEARREEDPRHHQALSITRARRHFGTFYKGPVMNRGPSKTKLARGPMSNINKLRAPKMPRGMRRGHCNTYREWGHFARECTQYRPQQGLFHHAPRCLEHKPIVDSVQ